MFLHVSVCAQGSLPTDGGGGSLPTRGFLGRPPPETRKAGGTHPTGMLSCLKLLLWSNLNVGKCSSLQFSMCRTTYMHLDLPH